MGWFLAWPGAVALILLGAGIDSRFLMWFGAASFFVVGPGLLWLSEHWVKNLDPVEPPPEIRHEPMARGETRVSSDDRPKSRKSKPRPRDVP